MPLRVCTQVRPEHPASPACTNKSMVMLIPEFFWPCSSLITKLLDLSKLSHLLTVWRSVSHVFREKFAPIGYHYCFTGSAQHWLCSLSLLFGKNDAFYRTLYSGISQYVTWCHVLFRLHQTAGATVCST